jgi:hypothetical protein
VVHDDSERARNAKMPELVTQRGLQLIGKCSDHRRRLHYYYWNKFSFYEYTIPKVQYQAKRTSPMRRRDKAIITCAITGAVHMPCMSEHLPITPEQIAAETIAAVAEGAAIIHLHARDPRDGRPTTDPDVYAQFLAPIAAHTDAIINFPTVQPGTFEERMAAEAPVGA